MFYLLYRCMKIESPKFSMCNFVEENGLKQLFFGPDTVKTILKVVQNASDPVFEIYMHALTAMIR